MLHSLETTLNGQGWQGSRGHEILARETNTFTPLHIRSSQNSPTPEQDMPRRGLHQDFMTPSRPNPRILHTTDVRENATASYTCVISDPVAS